MNQKDALKKLIENKGRCSESCFSTNTPCPLGDWKRREDGRFLGCVEAVDIKDISDENKANEKYLEAAERRLIEIEMEEAIDGTEQ